MMIRHDEEVLYFSSSTLVMLARSGTYYVVFFSLRLKALPVSISLLLCQKVYKTGRGKAPPAAEFSSMCVSYFHSSPCRDNMAGASGILPSLRIMEMNSSRPPSMMCTCDFEVTPPSEPRCPGHL